MKFAQSAKNVHTSAKVNEMLDDKSLIRKLRREIEALKKQLHEEETADDEEREEMEKKKKDKELTEVQSKLEDLSRDMRNK